VSETTSETRYSFGLRFRPPRGRKYISAMMATTATTAMATIETVVTASITPRFFPDGLCAKRNQRREWCGSRSGERAGEAGEDAKVGVKRLLSSP
jgi:hypothetical protein